MKTTIGWTLLLAACILFKTSPSFGAEPKYVGVEGCKCHKSELEEWTKSEHGEAFKNLLPPDGKKEAKKRKKEFSKINEKLKADEQLDPEKDYSKDPKCLPCHTVGYGKEGGFVDMATTPQLAGVGCEMCHGAGSEYRVLHKDKEQTFTRAEDKALGAVSGKEDEGVCRKCHEHPDNPMRSEMNAEYKFDWKEALSQEKKAFHKIYPLLYKH